MSKWLRNCIAIAAVATLFSAGRADASAITGGAVCETPYLYNLGTPKHTKVLPFGCSFDSSSTFTFSNVPDAASLNHTLQITDLQQFASLGGIGGVYITGTVDSAPFSGFAIERHPRDTLGSTILPVPTASYPVTLISELIAPTRSSTLPAGFNMQLDPGQTSGGTYSVAAGPIINGTQYYDVTDAFSLYFQASLNNGATWVSADPTFTLQTLAPGLPNYAPISAYIRSVPEAPTIGVMGFGLAVIAGIALQRKAERRVPKAAA